MKPTKMCLAISLVLASGSAMATVKDCGCTKTPTAYDKTQDVKIGANTAVIGDVKLTAGQAFDIAVEGRATAGNALSTVYGLIPQVNNNAKGIADLQASKVDKSVFTADQQRQDKALTSTVTAQAGRDAGQDQHINAVQDAAQSANVKADGLAVRADGIEQRATVTDDRSISNAVRLDGAEGAIRETNDQLVITDKRSQNNAVRLDGVETVNTQQSEAISQEARTRASQVVQLSAGISQAQATGDYAASRADQAFSNAAANSQSIRRTNERVAEHSAQLANHEQRITGLEQKTNRDFATMGKRIDKVQDKANAGVSAAFASAGIPQVTDGQRFAMGAGVGGYEGESALAVGFSTRISHAVVLKASVASDSQSGFGYNAGVSVGW